MTTGVEQTVAIVVGAGPAGLSTAASLQKLSIPYILLERDDCVASLFNKKTFDRFHLHLPQRFCQLAHMPFPSNFPAFVPRTELLKYCDDYASHFDNKLKFGNLVKSAKYDEDRKIWKVETKMVGDGVRFYEARYLVVATGENCEPFMPEVDGLSEFKGEVIHSTEYKSGKKYENKNVLVVGAGNSGMEVAHDLSKYGAKTSVVVRSPQANVRRYNQVWDAKTQRRSVFSQSKNQQVPGHRYGCIRIYQVWQDPGEGVIRVAPVRLGWEEKFYQLFHCRDFRRVEVGFPRIWESQGVGSGRVVGLSHNARCYGGCHVVPYRSKKSNV